VVKRKVKVDLALAMVGSSFSLGTQTHMKRKNCYCRLSRAKKYRSAKLTVEFVEKRRSRIKKEKRGGCRKVSKELGQKASLEKQSSRPAHAQIVVGYAMG